MTRVELSEFLEAFPTPLQHIPPQSVVNSWVFWNGSKNCSSSDDVGTPMNAMIHDKIKSALSKLVTLTYCLAQFWAPVTIEGRQLLSTSGQPFSVDILDKEFAMYRLYSEKYQYNIDMNYYKDALELEGDHMIKSDGPATAFLTRFPCIYDLHWMKSQDDAEELDFSLMLPFCFPSQTSSCIGVLELTMNRQYRSTLSYVIGYVKEAGFGVFDIQDRIPYETINGLKLTKEKIKEATKVVCASHNLALAQVWIAYEDKSMVPLSDSLEDTQTKRLLALKLTDYMYDDNDDDDDDDDIKGLSAYCAYCDLYPFSKEELARKTLQDYYSRYTSKLCSTTPIDWAKLRYEISAFVICLRSIDTGDFCYAFEFQWRTRSDPTIILESILSTLKRLLPGFKFASGAELDDDLDVIDIASSTDTETNYINIFHVKRSSSMPKSLDTGKKPMPANHQNLSPSKVRGKTTPVELSYEDVKKQFGKPMEEAAKNLGVGKSTLNRRWKDYFKNSGEEFRPWPGPRSNKRKVNDLSTIQIDTNEDVNGAIQEPSTDNIIIEATYADDTIKFPLNISEAPFITLEREIGKRFKLSVGTYKLKYVDENGRKILLTSDDEMSSCIESSRIVVQLNVYLIN